MTSATMKHCRFQKSLTDPADFTLSFELVPGRGGRSTVHTRALDLAASMAADGRICAVSITDNAGGHATLAPSVLGKEILEIGMDVISHFSCKDKNRNMMESLLYGWDRIGLNNLLVIAGDYPQKGYCGHPKPVFDLDTVHVIDLLTHLNNGETTHGLQPTSFYIGVVISPFKYTEAELMMQYYKLQRKVAAGAHYGITQLGFDARKYQEALLYVSEHNLGIPLLGNLFIPNIHVARLMHKRAIPGCLIPDHIFAEMEKESRSADRGKKARLERAANQLAVLRGLGYSGAHIGGSGLEMADIDFILNQATARQEQWPDLLTEFRPDTSQGFYYYQKDIRSNLNQKKKTALAPRKRQAPLYHFSNFIHNLAFEPHGLLYKLAKKWCLALDKTMLGRPLFWLEHLSKFILFACRNCGDCTLAEYGYRCPQSGCAKYLLNGPCGGSIDGWCEVYPGQKRCHYVLTYDRLKTKGCADDLGYGYIPPRDWSLTDASAWVHFYAGTDHSQRHCGTPASKTPGEHAPPNEQQGK
ncbi:MAG: methylenetetrahydrofolate reductase C-terminal domain-containing protein [Proteobacteria bacterium]|nr:methylenetetrahydrofolate reductase C-terminal domain-containing protein [Pseudomonadota bacterium]MBU1639685.1 methylenetetrahydrofolate reductase C-terminal domain-containing protein [Pseudomonadota bacterium]